ncbi:MAG: type IV pilus twitching motility protein PilT [Planctomycetes bacterium]|nr:type IV pilus twitching motility protein PilT [Planctomycetota bacterium]
MAAATLEELLQRMVERGASDLHVTTDSPPRIRVDGDLVPTEHDILGPEETKRLVYGLLTSEQVARFEQNRELDFSFGVQGLGRFRTNVFQQRGAVGMVLRIIPTTVVPLEKLGLPVETCKKLCMLPKGLVLVTGATGSGKSTTLAAMLDFINQNRQEHVVTIEDPIEFVHSNKKALFNQREVGSDTKGFTNALRAVLRQDPDVVLIGEMRDPETISAALTLSETGHLTFGTLHTSDCVQTMNRIIDSFPAHQQPQVRTQLSFVLQAVFCQQLLPKASGKGRLLASEVMVCNAAIRSLIREDKSHQIYSQIQTGGRQGMRTMNQSLAEHVDRGNLSYETVMEYTTDPDDLKRVLKRA